MKVASGQAFCSVESREGNCNGSEATTEWMFASCAPCTRLTCRVSPLSFVPATFVAALKLGLNGSAEQFLTWKGLDTSLTVLKVEVNSEVVLSAPQLVGLKRKFARLIATLRFFRRSGTPPTIVGRLLVAITCPVWGSTLSPTRVTTTPRLKGPATAATGIDRPRG